ncbi:MAG: hypothetical protein ABSH39_19945 [Candidatus Acidiferrum sp.]|jgi:hypothetical protein
MSKTIHHRQSRPPIFTVHLSAARLIFFSFCAAVLLTGSVLPSASADTAPVHGLWVWKGPTVLAAPSGAEKLRDFCQSQNINEVYISVSEHGGPLAEAPLAHLIELLHRDHIHVEALLDSANADEPGKHREKLLGHIRDVIQFNQHHPKNPFDGIHLDIEPQQRPENKGPGNLIFLPGLVDAYRAARALAEPAHLPINADIQNKLLKGTVDQRKMLLSALPRVTLMLYELSSPTDGQSLEQKTEKLRKESQKFLDMAYEGLHDPNLAKMVIGLRTPDYLDALPQMLKSLDEAHGTNPHYAGWSRHSYNDTLPSAK